MPIHASLLLNKTTITIYTSQIYMAFITLKNKKKITRN